MSLCPICKYSKIENFHYGVPSCKACAMVFYRYVADPKPVDCKSDPQYCMPGTASSRLLCRKCRIKRCYAVGMDAKQITVHYRRVCNQENAIPPAPVLWQHLNQAPFPFMSQISKGMTFVRNSLEHRFPFTGRVRGAFEQNELFFSMQEHFSMLHIMYDFLQQAMQSLDAFRPIGSLAVESSVKKAMVPLTCLLSYFNGFNNAQKQQTTWLADGRNYTTTGIYVGQTYETFYYSARHSYPYASVHACKNVAQTRYEMREGANCIFEPIAHQWLVDQNCQDAFLVLLLLELTRESCTDENMNVFLENTRLTLMNEMLAYYQWINADVSLQQRYINNFMVRMKNLTEMQDQKLHLLKACMEDIQKTATQLVAV